MKTEKEIYDQIDKASEIINDHGTDVPGITYEEGVKAALEWVLFSDDKPIE